MFNSNAPSSHLVVQVSSDSLQPHSVLFICPHKQKFSQHVSQSKFPNLR